MLITYLIYLRRSFINLIALHSVPDITFEQEELRQEPLGGPRHETARSLTPFPSKASTGAYHPIRVFHFTTIFVMYLTCAFTYRSSMKP
jgi:hypothetical protein